MRRSFQKCVASLLTCWVVQAAVGVARQDTPSYYWSRTKSGSTHFSQRPHIGPLPHVNEVMTEWARWSSWARCSRSCGGGVRSRSRTCVTRFPRVMPGSGIRTSHDQCSGQSLEYGVCGTAPCPPGQVSALSFRAAQCRHYNNRRVFGRLVNNWVPYTQGGINPCALVCEGEGEGVVYTFGKVTDGTHCRTHLSQDGLCVNGRCLRLSCDGRLGGSAREDMCRVCGGRNDTCTHHVGVFHTDLPAADQPTALAHARAARPRSFGYYEVTHIPKGATNVRVKDSSANFLALKAGTKYMLNGDWLIDWPGEVEAGGTSFIYSRAEDDSESLTTLGPTSEDLTLMVLLREHNPGIHYEYWTSNSQVSSPAVSNTTTSTTSTTTTSNTAVTTSNTSSSTLATTTIATTTTLTPRPAVLTRINMTRYHRPPPAKPPQSPTMPRRSDNEVHITSPRHKQIKPSKSKARKVKNNKKGKKQKSHRGKKGKERKDKAGKERRGKKEKGGSKKKQSEMPATCEPCEKPRRETKQMFCTSDFVSRVEVLNSEAVGRERRYEVLVHQSYKNTVPLLHKEFLWVTNPCHCPLLRHGRSYLVMGITEVTRGREVRLVLTRKSYVRRYKPQNLARILRIRHNEMRFCRPWRRDLRFVQVAAPNDTLPATT